MIKKHRVKTSLYSFDIQHHTGKDKDGVYRWMTLGYYRNKKELMKGLKNFNLPVELGKDIWSYHQDSLDKLIEVTKPVSEAKKIASRGNAAKATAAREKKW